MANSCGPPAAQSRCRGYLLRGLFGSRPGESDYRVSVPPLLARELTSSE